ncbi:hypothetical protein F8S13_23710 [Chloroflexia bacterium SDU3-3]|nr:hypothetical protein F8S13_23710 [Chloroflexia bacterium SDU3-3]
MPPSRKTPYDLEEITPNHFLVHNDNAYSVLRGEGERRGKIFELTSWRREGLLARLALRTYVVLTLEGRMERLPQLPAAPALGELGWRPTASASERYSVFDPAARAWVAIEPVQRDGGAALALREGTILRRRKGRGAAEYFRCFMERGGTIGIRPLDENSALLASYAQAAPIPLVARRTAEGYHVAKITLPGSYRDFLARLGSEVPDGWLVEEAGWPYAQRMFNRIGVQLTLDEAG